MSTETWVDATPVELLPYEPSDFSRPLGTFLAQSGDWWGIFRPTANSPVWEFLDEGSEEYLQEIIRLLEQTVGFSIKELYQYQRVITTAVFRVTESMDFGSYEQPPDYEMNYQLVGILYEVKGSIKLIRVED